MYGRYLIWILLINLQSACGQNTAANRLGHCQDKRFDREVARWIGFKVPAIDVDSIQAKPGKYTLLDAREPREFRVSHLPGAINCGYDDFNLSALDSLDRNKPIAVYCSIGYRSEKIAQKLMQAGFIEVYNVYGSIFEWVNRGYPVVDASDKQTMRIHAYNRLWGRWVKNASCEKVYQD